MASSETEMISDFGSWRVVVINSWKELRDRAENLLAPNPASANFAFRGQSFVGWSLLPSLPRRLINGLSDENADTVERLALSEFRSQAHLYVDPSLLQAIVSSGRRLEWWSLMQHHGAPTRLLDWTLSPFVGAYFAAEDVSDRDGVVFVAQVPSVMMGYTTAGGIKDGQKKDVDKDAPKLVSFWEPSRKTQRLIVQQGIFSVCTHLLSSHDAVLDQQCKGMAALERWIIPAKLKPELLLQLRHLNISAQSLFPGVDGLGRSVTELLSLGLSGFAGLAGRVGISAFGFGYRDDEERDRVFW
jgi:FRG domain-containing protein